ncbi:hypothetical protein GCG54_00003687 [Colletotrichum gloeosporioides]|uniref:Uncharacterized protein n=2 Tax=Colletotrichum gloeosporioides TaxID=474922 RepID=T0LJZ4_COLGC|nr:uncharacterized protein GCG54_00003687 [Colletotrichum gloeosporioides]EQB48490.1 hypothetical protein CGLO_12278 [Colletotrichum gloeosporioides Cg-14]KAF3811938.1 hypothetical protein GCG54_00003687 [Colletotrichum gloeosporioides]
MSSSDGTTKKPLTDRELEILKHAWSCMKTPPEIDYPKLAEACGMTNPRSASNAWAAIKKKLFADMPAPAANEDGTAATTPAKRKRATPRKKTAPAPTPSTEEDDEEADELTNATEEKLVVETPVKKKRTPAKKKAAAPAAASQGDADAEDTVSPETPAKKKRATPAKKRATPAKAKKEQEEAAAAAEEEDELTTTPQEEPKFEVKEEAKAEEDVQMEGGQDSAEI